MAKPANHRAAEKWDQKNFVSGWVKPTKAHPSLREFFASPVAVLPVIVDYSPYVNHVWAQVGGSCVGHGCWGAYALRQIMTKALDLSLLSPQYVYGWARMFDGTYGNDVGTSVSSGMYAMNNQGLCTDALFAGESNPTWGLPKPGSTAYNDGLTRRTVIYTSLNYSGQSLVTAMKQSIASGYPVVTGSPI